jgi:hypothetical protein
MVLFFALLCFSVSGFFVFKNVSNEVDVNAPESAGIVYLVSHQESILRLLTLQLQRQCCM